MPDEFEERQEAARKQQEFEQGIAWLRQFIDSLPPSWRRIYLLCVTEGFTESQSIELLKTYIISQGTGDKKAP